MLKGLWFGFSGFLGFLFRVPRVWDLGTGFRVQGVGQARAPLLLDTLYALGTFRSTADLRELHKTDNLFRPHFGRRVVHHLT